MTRTLYVVEARMRTPGSRRWGGWHEHYTRDGLEKAKDRARSIRWRYAPGVCETRIWAFDRRDRPHPESADRVVVEEA